MRYGSFQFGRRSRSEPLLPYPVPLPTARRAIISASRLSNGRCARHRRALAGAVAVPPVACRANPNLRAARRADVEPKRDARPVAARGWTQVDPGATLAADRRSNRPVAIHRGLPMAVGGPHLFPETGRPPYPPATTGTRVTSRGDYENEREVAAITSPELRGKMAPPTLPARNRGTAGPSRRSREARGSCRAT